MGNLVRNGIFGCFVVYGLGWMWFGTNYNYAYQERIGFMEWLIFGELKPSMHAMAWPYYVWTGTEPDFIKDPTTKPNASTATAPSASTMPQQSTPAGLSAPTASAAAPAIPNRISTLAVAAAFSKKCPKDTRPSRTGTSDAVEYSCLDGAGVRQGPLEFYDPEEMDLLRSMTIKDGKIVTMQNLGECSPAEKAPCGFSRYGPQTEDECTYQGGIPMKMIREEGVTMRVVRTERTFYTVVHMRIAPPAVKTTWEGNAILAQMLTPRWFCFWKVAPGEADYDALGAEPEVEASVNRPAGNATDD